MFCFIFFWSFSSFISQDIWKSSRFLCCLRCELTFLGTHDLREAVDTTFPSPEDLRDPLLPQARRRVAALRNSAVRPAGDFDSMGVSWTKPVQLMPFSYTMKYAADAGDGSDWGRPPEEEDDDPEGDHGEGGSGDGPRDGHGDGVDAQMSTRRP